VLHACNLYVSHRQSINSLLLPLQVSDGVFIVTGPLWLPQQDGRGSGKWEMRHPMIGEGCVVLLVLLLLLKIAEAWLAFSNMAAC
jgi:hypothetical protein